MLFFQHTLLYSPFQPSSLSFISRLQYNLSLLSLLSYSHISLFPRSCEFDWTQKVSRKRMAAENFRARFLPAAREGTMVRNSLISQQYLFTFPRAREWASERTDERVAQYLNSDFWLIWTVVEGQINAKKIVEKRTKPRGKNEATNFKQFPPEDGENEDKE